jgi:hypothetical protein
VPTALRMSHPRGVGLSTLQHADRTDGRFCTQACHACPCRRVRIPLAGKDVMGEMAGIGGGFGLTIRAACSYNVITEVEVS